VWVLQGSYGRIAADLIRMGDCTSRRLKDEEPKELNFD